VYVFIIQNVGGISSELIIENLHKSQMLSGLLVSLHPQILQSIFLNAIIILELQSRT